MDLGLFVYGTLRPGGSNHAWLRRTHPEGLALAWTPGRLFALPEGYPAVVPTDAPSDPPPGKGWVEGAYVGYETPEELRAALEDLDALEGVEEGLFDREIRPITLEGARQTWAWTYVFHVERLPQLERGAQELPDGRWPPKG